LDWLWSLNLFALILLNFLEGLTLVILVLDVFYPLSYERLHLFWKNSMNKLKGA